ncbi:hypothetical protein GIB67_028351, partial [Kingdonia uniflora]
AFMLLYFGGVLFGNLKSWARLELCPITILENKAYTIDFGSAILGHLYCCLDQASKQEVKYIGGLFQLIEAQLEHRAVPYDPPKKLHCFPTSDVVRSLRAVGWIEAQHYIVGHHVDYDAYWRYVSHGALMSDIARYKNIDIPGLRALTNGVTFPHVEFLTVDFSTQETQIPPLRLGNYPGWIIELGSPHGTMWHTIPSIASTSTIDVPTGYDFFVMTQGIRKLTLDRTLDSEARHLHDDSRIIHLTMDLRCANGRHSQLNDYLDGESIGKMTKVKREYLRRGLHGGEVHGGGVRREGHMKCCVPYLMNFKVILDVFIDSSSEEEKEEDIE